MKTRGAIDPATLRAVEYLKTILGRGIQYSKRGAMYTLLSEGLVWHRGKAVEPSTKDFHNVNRRLNGVLQADILTDEHFNDECFDDNRRRTEHMKGWKTRAEFDEFCKTLWTLDYWQNQPCHVEVWLEKDTASFLVKEVTERLRVPLRVSAGSFSRTFLYRIAENLASKNQPIKILYIGDFDPSGLDIERAAKRGETREEWLARQDGKLRKNGKPKQSYQPTDGLAEYLEKRFDWEAGRFESQVEWIRLGVTEEDWRTVPERARVPVKLDDTRAKDFVSKYGSYGAEIEALEVVERGLLARRLESHIWEYYIDQNAWAASEQQEVAER